VSDDQPFVPFSVRTGKRHPEQFRVLHEGVPGHLQPSLSSWFVPLWSQYRLQERVQRRLQIDVGQRDQSVYQYIVSDPVTFLDAVDYVLSFLHDRASACSAAEQDDIYGTVANLVIILREASSAYTVSHAWQLETRVDETAEQAFQAAVEHEQHSSELLKQAWASTFKRDPDPGKAFRASVLAVESVATELFTPKDRSLGKAIAHLRDTMETWTVAGLDDKQQASGATLLAMLRTVWENDQRHVGEGGKPPDPATQEEAEAVLFLAVTIVQWFERGFVRKR